MRQAPQRVQRHPKHPGGAYAGISDHERARHACALALFGQQAHRNVVNVDLGEMEDAGHGETR